MGFDGESPRCANCGSESEREVGEAPRGSELAVETVEGREAPVAGREGELVASMFMFIS